MSFLRLMQQLVISPLYFKYPLFKVDLEFLKSYWNKNPYRICKEFFFETDNKDVFYGETWPFSISYFKEILPLTEKDVLFDLGSGTSRISFWFQVISGCRVVAVEKVPRFVEIAKGIQKKLKNNRIKFLQKDLLEVDYSEASVIYFYSSNIEDKLILKLIEKWRLLKKGTKIITTSFSLQEYENKQYRVLGEYSVSYPWGKCDVYLQEKT